ASRISFLFFRYYASVTTIPSSLKSVTNLVLIDIFILDLPFNLQRKYLPCYKYSFFSLNNENGSH
uniref:Uncharacterized protein n=1 Tax=Oryza brachyantha TaxID=4533 RepID=J3NFA6_ORYBR